MTNGTSLTTMRPEDLAWALHNAALTQTQPAELQRCLDAADAEAVAIVDPALAVEPLVVADNFWPGQALYDTVVLQRAVEWWKANDAAFGTTGYVETGGLRAPDGGFERHARALLPLKQQWGLA